MAWADIDRLSGIALENATHMVAALQRNNWDSNLAEIGHDDDPQKNRLKHVGVYAENFLMFLLEDSDLSLDIRIAALRGCVQLTCGALDMSKNIKDGTTNKEELQILLRCRQMIKRVNIVKTTRELANNMLAIQQKCVSLSAATPSFGAKP